MGWCERGAGEKCKIASDNGTEKVEARGAEGIWGRGRGRKWIAAVCNMYRLSLRSLFPVRQCSLDRQRSCSTMAPPSTRPASSRAHRRPLWRSQHTAPWSPGKVLWHKLCETCQLSFSLALFWLRARHVQLLLFFASISAIEWAIKHWRHIYEILPVPRPLRGRIIPLLLPFQPHWHCRSSRCRFFVKYYAVASVCASYNPCHNDGQADRMWKRSSIMITLWPFRTRCGVSGLVGFLAQRSSSCSIVMFLLFVTFRFLWAWLLLHGTLKWVSREFMQLRNCSHCFQGYAANFSGAPERGLTSSLTDANNSRHS